MGVKTKSRKPCPRVNCLSCSLPECTATLRELEQHPDKIDYSLIRLLLCQDKDKRREMKKRYDRNKRITATDTANIGAVKKAT